MAAADLTVARLRELLRYFPDTGRIEWIVARQGPAKAGQPAGRVGNRGYVTIKILGKCYQAHRVAWALFHGEWPQGPIDHINCLRTDNRIENLRDANAKINAQNRRSARKDSQTGVIGVVPSRRNPGMFEAKIKANGVSAALGQFASEDLASAEYVRAKRIFHEGGTL